MASRYEQESGDKLQNPSRFSRDSTPSRAHQARHDEGQRWTHMEADDATWARTPEEQAWRNLNADTRAEQAAAPQTEDSRPFQLSSLFAFQPAQQPTTPDSPFSYPEGAGQAGCEQRCEYRYDPYYYQRYTQVYDTHLHDDFYYHDEYYDYDDFNRHQYYPQEFYHPYSQPAYYPPPAYEHASYPSAYTGYQGNDQSYRSPSQPYEAASVAAASVIAAGYVAPDSRDTLSQAAVDYAPQAWGSTATSIGFSHPVIPSEAGAARGVEESSLGYVSAATSYTAAAQPDATRFLDCGAYGASARNDTGWNGQAASFVNPELPNGYAASAASHVMHRQSVQTQADAAGSFLSDSRAPLLDQPYEGTAYSHMAPNVSEPFEGRSDYLHSSALGVIESAATPYASFIDSERSMGSVVQQSAWTSDMAALSAAGTTYSPVNQTPDLENRLTINQIGDSHNRLTVNRLVSDEPFAPVTAVGRAEQALAQERPLSVRFQPDDRVIANQVLEAHDQSELLVGYGDACHVERRAEGPESRHLAANSSELPLDPSTPLACARFAQDDTSGLSALAAHGTAQPNSASRLTVNQVPDAIDQGPAKRLTVNQVEDAQSRLTVNQIEEIQAQAAVNRDMRGWMSEAQQAQGVPVADTASAKAAAAKQLLVSPSAKHQQAEGLVLGEESMAKKQGAAEQVAGAPSAKALLRDAANPEDAVGGNAKAAAQTKAELGASEIKAASLGLASMAGGALLAGAKGAVGLTGLIFDRALREDEDLVKVADTAEAARDATAHMRKHAPGKGESASDKLVSAVAAQDLLRQEQLGDNVLKAKKIDVRHAGIGAADAEELAAGISTAQMLDEKPDVLERKPGGLRGKAVEAGEGEGAEQFVIPKDDALKDAKGGDKKKLAKESLKNRFEKKLAAKRQERLAKQLQKSHGNALDAIKNPASKGALLAEGAVMSGAKKVLTKESEELAIAVSMVEKAQKAKNAAKVPVKVYRRAQSIVQNVVAAIKGIGRTAVAFATSGPAGVVVVAIVFMLLVFLIAALIGTASIINDEQEISEVSALVAELDEDLTDEIRKSDSTGVYYCDARDTYGEKKGKKDLTKNVDLSDEKSDLKEVAASTVTIQTNPAEVVAYIDAKYTGNWQVGAASWKYTVDFNGKTWNIIQWDNMPEWCWKALNKIGKWGFYDDVAEGLGEILEEDYGIEAGEATEIANGIADEFANIVYNQQVQAVNEAVVTQVIDDGIDKHAKDLKLDKKEKKKLYYQMSEVVTRLIGEEEPFAFVYDEIVTLHERMNWWSDDYGKFETPSGSGGGTSVPTTGGGSGSGSSNKYGYPNSSGYTKKELEKWDGFNEVSVYGVSEAGTTATLADGTKITNTWGDTNMAIACEGLQNKTFAYWSKAYKDAVGKSDTKPVKITLYNPSTGKKVTAEVRDCGGWRGFNTTYSGMNADRQWDLLPAVWKALGGGENAGVMKVYWKVDPKAEVGGAAGYEPKDFKDYPWPKESDDGKGTITLDRPTVVVHGVCDALNNGPLTDEILDKDGFATEDEFKAIKSFVVTKVRGVMRSFLTMKNADGDEYTDYTYFRRSLSSPFGREENGDVRQWVVTKRYNPGYDKFDKDETEVSVKPLGDSKSVYAVMKGEVHKVKDGKVTVRTEVDTSTSAEITYAKLKGITVEEGDKVKRGQRLGKMSGKALKVSYYEVNDAALQIETKKKWAYDPGMFMMGFGGYVEPDAPEAYKGDGGGKSDYSKCKSVVEFARSRLGCPYVWGATGPDEFDCSGLTQWCYAHAGITIPRNSEEQHDAAAKKGNCHPIDLSKMQPGDIVWKSGHVGIYIGDDSYIHAPQTGDVVKVSKNVKALFTHYLRF